MKALAVRVKRAKVTVEGDVVSSIEKGLVLFGGIERSDDNSQMEEIARKVGHLRIFEDDSCKMNYSLKDKNLPVLCIPNFTLCASTDRGRRPSFENSMPRGSAGSFFNNFITLLKAQGLDVRGGAFGQHMEISLEMDGPVNIVLESNK